VGHEAQCGSSHPAHIERNDSFTEHRGALMQKIAPFLWFNCSLQEVVDFYTRIFPNTRVENISPMTATFRIEDQEFMALNGGPQFKFNEAVSFFIRCDTQEEVDYFWRELTSGGGSESQCGWLKDKFGLSWQVIPNALTKYLGDKDRDKANRVMQAMFKMKKIEIAALDAAYQG
jgi:predicted 3-demethylubiquinone-9 3-methyltransferase (glyoxalase superfamily)